MGSRLPIVNGDQCTDLCFFLITRLVLSFVIVVLAGVPVASARDLPGLSFRIECQLGPHPSDVPIAIRLRVVNSSDHDIRSPYRSGIDLLLQTVKMTVADMGGVVVCRDTLNDSETLLLSKDSGQILKPGESQYVDLIYVPRRGDQSRNPFVLLDPGKYTLVVGISVPANGAMTSNALTIDIGPPEDAASIGEYLATGRDTVAFYTGWPESKTIKMPANVKRIVEQSPDTSKAKLAVLLDGIYAGRELDRSYEAVKPGNEEMLATIASRIDKAEAVTDKFAVYRDDLLWQRARVLNLQGRREEANRTLELILTEHPDTNLKALILRRLGN